MTKHDNLDYEESIAGLPGADLIMTGLNDLRQGAHTECSLLVSIASPRLRHLGFDVPESKDIPSPHEHQLYSLLEQTHGEAAYSRYNSLLRRIASFSQSLEHRLNAK